MRVAVYQNNAAMDGVDRRLAQLEDVAGKLAGETDLLVTSELFAGGYHIGTERHRVVAEPIPGPVTERIAAIAKAAQLAIVCGLAERAGSEVYNAAIVADASGRIIARHRKLHLPPGFETSTFARGDVLTLFELGGFKIGVLVCYDVEFPESVRALAIRGAELVVVPTALSRQWERLTRTLVPTRAFENGVFIVYANHAGEEHGLTYAGGSCIIGPDGLDLARAGAGEEVISATLDTAAVAAARARLPYLGDLRRDVLA